MREEYRPDRVGDHKKASVSLRPDEMTAVLLVSAQQSTSISGAIRYIIRTHQTLKKFFK